MFFKCGWAISGNYPCMLDTFYMKITIREVISYINCWWDKCIKENYYNKSKAYMNMLRIRRWTNPLILILRVAAIIINNIDEKSKINEWTTIMTHINLIEVHPSVQTTTSSKQSLTWPKGSQVQYSGDFLHHVKTKVDHNRILQILPTDACVKIRALRINRRKTSRSKNKKNKFKWSGTKVSKPLNSNTSQHNQW